MQFFFHLNEKKLHVNHGEVCQFYIFSRFLRNEMHDFYGFFVCNFSSPLSLDNVIWRFQHYLYHKLFISIQVRWICPLAYTQTLSDIDKYETLLENRNSDKKEGEVEVDITCN